MNLFLRLKLLERDKCYDVGDGFLLWKLLFLYFKFFMLLVLKGIIILCIIKLCELVSC